MKSFLYLLLIFLSASCAFNGSFFEPNRNSVHTPPDAVSQYITYGTHDSIHSLFYEHKDPIASIFILHGNAGNLDSWGEVADLFHQGGYQVFIIDYPEFGNSSGEATFESLFESTQAAVNFYSQLPSVKNTKKLLMGFSLGGNLALKVATENSDIFDALLIEGAFESQKAIGVNRVARPFKFMPRIFLKNQIKGREAIAQWKKPLLIIHSKNDAVCPYEMGQLLYNSATGTTEKELWTIKGPHLAGLGANFTLYLSKMKQLVEKS